MSEHDDNLKIAFATVTRCEDALAALKSKEAVFEENAKRERDALGLAMADAWAEIKRLMDETGEYEVTLPGDVADYRIGWSTPRESVKVEESAVPDEFCKVERKPRLKEIASFLNGLRDSGLSFPNWARFELSEPKLCWKAVKKTAAEPVAPYQPME